MSKLIDLIGRRFGRLVVLERGLPDKWGSCSWFCRCDCGELRTVNGAKLRSKETNSCGCLNREKKHTNTLRHGHARKGKQSIEYGAWLGMNKRCYDPSCDAYRYYGGRQPPVTIHEPWRHSFDTFLASVLSEIGSHPGKGFSLDRRNNDLGYVPGNLKWSTPTEQAEHTRRNRIVTIDGITGPVSVVCRQLALPCRRVYALLAASKQKRTPQEVADYVRKNAPRSGWSASEAL
jgi:hypothetical protein